MTSENCRPSEDWTLFAADFHVSRSAPPLAGSAKARQTTVSSGLRCLPLSHASGPLGSLLKTLLTSTDWHSTKWFLTWKPVGTRSRRRLKFRLVPSDTITGAHASGLSATPTATANQDCPSMQKWPGCRGAIVDPGEW